jgi:mannan endo-1,4-beta-mannosidase
LQKWTWNAAKAVKSLDKRHLLTVGEEGFYASTKNYVNPAKWASDTGQNFISDHIFTEIDYASSHLWTDNWNLFSAWSRKHVKNDSFNFSKTWIEEHSSDSLNILQKPFVLSEYGSTGFGNRNNIIGSLVTTEDQRQTKVSRFYSEVHTALLQNRNGALFWIWHNENLKYLPSYQDEYGIFVSDNVFDRLRNYSQVLRS